MMASLGMALNVVAAGRVKNHQAKAPPAISTATTPSTIGALERDRECPRPMTALRGPSERAADPGWDSGVGETR
jgi:hypothetical protein